MDAETNSYSRHWFEFFHVRIDEARTNREVEFICSCAPQPEFQKILDVCCGMGRHSLALSQRGYAVTGIDRDTRAIERACQLAGGASYVAADIRDYQLRPEGFDAVTVMGQSFGHFDLEANLDVLRRLAVGVRKRGRVILDLWNPEFFAKHQGKRELNSPRGAVRETKRIEDDRLLVELKYPDGAREKFEWQLFSPRQMEDVAEAAGLTVVIACSGFDPKNLPSPSDPRIQFVLERVN